MPTICCDAGKCQNAVHVRRILARLDELSDGVDPPPRPAMLNFLACFHVDEGFLLLERHCVAPQTSEERIVHDANYLEVLGAFGIAKTFTKGGAENQNYEQTMAIFERNLRRVEFRTPGGVEASDEGRRYAQAFLDRLRREL